MAPCRQPNDTPSRKAKQKTADCHQKTVVADGRGGTTKVMHENSSTRIKHQVRKEESMESMLHLGQRQRAVTDGEMAKKANLLEHKRAQHTHQRAIPRNREIEASRNRIK